MLKRCASRFNLAMIAMISLYLAGSAAVADQVVYFANGKAMMVKKLEVGEKVTILEMVGGGRIGVPSDHIVRVEEYAVSTPAAPAAPRTPPQRTQSNPVTPAISAGNASAVQPPGNSIVRPPAAAGPGSTGEPASVGQGPAGVRSGRMEPVAPRQGALRNRGQLSGGNRDRAPVPGAPGLARQPGPGPGRQGLDRPLGQGAVRGGRGRGRARVAPLRGQGLYTGRLQDGVDQRGRAVEVQVPDVEPSIPGETPGEEPEPEATEEPAPEPDPGTEAPSEES